MIVSGIFPYLKVKFSTVSACLSMVYLWLFFHITSGNTFCTVVSFYLSGCLCTPVSRVILSRVQTHESRWQSRVKTWSKVAVQKDWRKCAFHSQVAVRVIF